MKVTCCKDCTSRHYKCHATCKTYQAEKEKMWAEKQAYNKSNSVRAYEVQRANRVKMG